MLVNGLPGNTISIRDRGLLYGDGVFRTFPAQQGKAKHWPLHFLKLQSDCAALGLDCPDATLLSAELEGLLERHPDGIVKLIVTRGQGKRGYTPDSSSSSHIWDILPLPVYSPEMALYGITTRLCDLRLASQPRLAGIKHLNRLENVLAAAEPGNTGFDEGLLLDQAGNLVEGIRSNVFLVLHGILVTPDLSSCGVAGVQRDRVIAWAAQHDMPVQIRAIRSSELLDADELFVVNSVIGLWPVRELGQQRWREFPVASGIARDLDEQDARQGT